jgi:hypothetical protein
MTHEEKNIIYGFSTFQNRIFDYPDINTRIWLSPIWLVSDIQILDENHWILDSMQHKKEHACSQSSCSSPPPWILETRFKKLPVSIKTMVWSSRMAHQARQSSRTKIFHRCRASPMTFWSNIMATTMTSLSAVYVLWWRGVFSWTTLKRKQAFHLQ